MINISMPQIMYIPDPNVEKIGLYYLGGEPEENHRRLTVGKLYHLKTKFYSPPREVNIEPLLIRVWTTEDDENKGKLCRVELNNFGTLADVRNKKIEKIIE